jgi:hypothetical protein
MPCGVPEPLPSDEEAVRLVRHGDGAIEFDHDAGQWIPTARSMQFDADGLSLYWVQHVENVHNTPLSAVLRTNYPLLFCVSVEYARELGFDADHVPVGGNLPDCAHVALKYPAGVETAASKKALRARLIERMTLVLGEIALIPQPGG